MTEAFIGEDVTIKMMGMTVYDGLAAATNWFTHASSVDATVLAKSISFSGGETPIENEAFFGGAMLTFRQPREPFELSMTVRIPTATADANFWESLTYGAGLTSSGSPVAQIIGFEANAGAGFVKRIEFKNAEITNYEPSFEADSYMQAEITFRVSPTDADGNANIDFDPDFIIPA